MQELTSGPDVNFLSREQLYEDAVRRAVHVQKLLKQWKLVDSRDIGWLNMIAFPWEAPPDRLHTGESTNVHG